jgi:ATP-binding cassette subfamily F protein 3
VCDGFVLVADGRARPFDGDVDDYLEWLGRRRAPPGTAETTAPDVTRETRRAQRDATLATRRALRARRRPLVSEAARLESDIALWHRDKHAVDARLADPTTYAAGNGADIASAARRSAELATQISRAEERWLEIQAQLDSMGEA